MIGRRSIVAMTRVREKYLTIENRQPRLPVLLSLEILLGDNCV
jgi:hypothetical protein